VFEHHGPPALTQKFIAAAYDLIGGADQHQSSGPALVVIEQVRQEVAAVLTNLGPQPDVVAEFSKPLTDWHHADRLVHQTSVNVVDLITRSTPCRDAALALSLAVAAVAAWRMVTFSVVDCRNNDGDWQPVVDQATQTIHLCRWIRSGGAARAFGSSR